MTITVDVRAEKVLRDLSDDLVDEKGLIRELTLQGTRYCKQEAPKDTGDLARSINPKINGSTGEVKTNIEYARHVIYGTSAHEITVKNKKVLSDHNSGSTHRKDAIYGTRVMHPGTRPNNFPARAVKRIKGQLPNIARKYVKVKS
mgnify:CR=1 FL=1